MRSSEPEVQGSFLDTLELARSLSEGKGPRRSLVNELDRITVKPQSSSPLAAVALAASLANQLRPSVRASHRKGATGRLVTAGKHATLRVLSGFNTELLRPQREFNLRLLRALEALSTEVSPSTRRDLTTLILPQLQQATDPTRWRVHGHRKGIPGAAIRTIKQGYLEAARQALDLTLRKQQEWNKAATNLLHHIGDAAAPDIESKLKQLRRLEAELAEVSLPPTLRPLASVFAELLFPQSQYRTAVREALETLFGVSTASSGAVVVSADDWREQLAPVRPRDGVAEDAPSFRVHVVGAAQQSPVTLASLERQTVARWRLDDSPSADFELYIQSGAVLAPDAIAQLSRAIHATEADVFYTDEVLPDGAARLKPGPSRELLRTSDYFGSLLVARRNVVEAAGRLRPGQADAQLFDLGLRLCERTTRIQRVPGPLVSVLRRTAPTQNHVTALREHLERSGEAATVALSEESLRIRYSVAKNPLVSIIIPFRDKPALLKTVVETLLSRTSYSNYELILLSNNSVLPETRELLESFSDPRIRKFTWDHPFNYPAINNFGARQARGELLLFLNNDIEITNGDWLELMVGQALRPSVGVVGAQLLYPNGRIQHAGVTVGIGGFAAHLLAGAAPDARSSFVSPQHSRNCLAVTSACMMMRREVFRELGGFDEAFIVCGSDVDLGIKAHRAGLEVIYEAGAQLIHHESASRRGDNIPASDFWWSYVSYLPYLREGDPFYHPHLSLTSTDCSLRRVKEPSAEDMAIEALRKLSTPSPAPVRSEKVERSLRTVSELEQLDSLFQSRPAFSAEEGLKALRAQGSLRSACWFLPYFEHPFGGVHTLLRFANLWEERHGVRSELVIYNNPTASRSELNARVAQVFPRLEGRVKVLEGPEGLAQLPACDLAIATYWSSAYYCAAHPRATLRSYFVQDFEPLFHAAGSLSAATEQSYRLGLYGIFNTRGLHDAVVRDYPMSGCWFEPSVDPNVFHAQGRAPHTPARVFFYARPSSDRNAFELGIAALKRVKSELGRDVEILSAGEDWRPSDFGLEGRITHLGVLPFDKTGELYRKCDVGLVFMFTKHPSYLPLEMMACGMTVVTNDNPANHWLLEHERNCLLTEPTVSSVAAALKRALSEPELRAQIGAAASARMQQSSWEAAAERVYQSIVRGEST